MKNLHYLLLTVTVFLVNFSFSSPRVPRVATLPFFLVLVVKEKFKFPQKYLTVYCLRFDRIKKLKTFYLKIKNAEGQDRTVDTWFFRPVLYH